MAQKTAAKKAQKGDVYECGVCGLEVIIDEECGCDDVCDIICCGEPMKEKQVKVKTKSAAKK
jgi:hypothetical protein